MTDDPNATSQHSGEAGSRTTRRKLVSWIAMTGLGFGGGYYAVKSTTDTAESPSKNWRGEYGARHERHPPARWLS